MKTPNSDVPRTDTERVVGDTSRERLDAHGEDRIPDLVLQELMAAYTRLTAAPIPDDAKELEAQIREFDRIQAAIAERLRVRSSV